MEQVLVAVAAVHEARKRLGIDTRKTFFGHYDVWTYIAEGPIDTNCPKCMELDAQDFMGSHLRQMFPDLMIMDEDTIYPNVHQTLWGKPTCKCILRRASEPLDALDIYDGDNLEPYKPAPKQTDASVDYGYSDEV
jgi:hypothetical protein